MHKFTILLIGIMLTVSITHLSAQVAHSDTLKLTIEDAEKVFLQRNLELLAQKYSVDAQKALIIQARTYPNPSVSYGFGTNRPAGYPQESYAGVQQLILLAGKRKRQIHMAETSAMLSEDSLYDLLRTLKYTLRSDFFSIYYWQQTARVYSEEINALQKVVTSGGIQFEKGFIAKTELVRDQAQLYSLESEYNDLINQINDKESEVRIIIDTTGSGVYIIPIIDTARVISSDPFKYPLAALLDSAEKNRADLMIARDNLTLATQNYKLQKSLAVPDLTVGDNWDAHGGPWSDYNAVTLGIDIPIFNRNRGNIKSARFMINSDSAQYELTLHQTHEQIFRALELAETQYKLYQSLDKNFGKTFEDLSKEVLDQYLKRNMGMLDFLTFYDSYKTNIVQLNSILANLANAYENIDYMTGTDFFIK